MRALAVSLPLLVAAESVLVITVGGYDTSDSDIPAVLDYLASRGSPAGQPQIPATSSESTGVLLLNAAQEAGADMLVMGGYGHKPWREALFGGVTRDIVSTSLLPLLLMHWTWSHARTGVAPTPRVHPSKGMKLIASSG